MRTARMFRECLWFLVFCLVQVVMLGGVVNVSAAPPVIIDPGIQPVVINPYPWVEGAIIVQNVTDNDVDDTNPSLNNGYAFWYHEGSNDEIYMWDTSKPGSSAAKVTTGNPSGVISSYGNAVAFGFGTAYYWKEGKGLSLVAKNTIGLSLYDDTIAYSQLAGSGGFDIIVRKGFSETNLTNNSAFDFWPSLYDNTVAWHGNEDGDFDIYYYDGNHIYKITNNDNLDGYPSLYDGAIAWQGSDGDDYEIYYWDGTTITQLTNDTDGTPDLSPSLYNGKIAWARKMPKSWEIFYWNGSSIIRVTNNDQDDKNPRLYNGAIIWQHYDGHDWEIQYAEVDVPKAPTVSTLAADNITQNAATINGKVNPNGQVATYHFDWGTSTSYNRVTPDKSAGSGTSSVDVSEGLTNLDPGTTYHYRLVAVSPAGTSTGQDNTFTTEQVNIIAPSVVTGNADDVTANSAKLRGTVNPSGADTRYHFDYGTDSANYTSHTPWVNAGNGSSGIPVSMDVNGLDPETTYYFRLVAENSGGLTRGNDNSFETQPEDDPMADTARRFTGWWYNSAEPGTGLAIQIKGSNIFVAWFVYDEAGRTCWYASGGPMTNDTTYTGNLMQWTGWPWGEPYVHPTGSVVGTMTLIFNKAVNDSIIFNASVNGKTASGTMTSFMKDFAPGDKDSRDLTGWWWDSDYDGMGFFLDARGGKMAMVWYNYRADNSPRWWTSNGPFADGSTSYAGSLDGWQGGQAPGGSYQAPVMLPGEGGDMTINFTDADHAVLTVGGTTVHLERFSF